MVVITLFLQYSETRLNAALAEHNIEYKFFRSRLEEAHILLDNVVLSQLAIYEPRTFKSLVDLCKKLNQENGIAVIASQKELDSVSTSPDLHGTPFLKAKYYPSGPSVDHKKPPRKLREEEY